MGGYILLVEPDVPLSRTIQRALENKGFRVKTAQGGQEAISISDDCSPCLIICEIQLVSHSGIEFLYELRSYSDWQTIPVIINSLVPPGEFADCRVGLTSDLAVTAYLYKPHTSLKKLINSVSLTLAGTANEPA